MGATPRAVRYYEELGLLPERGRAARRPPPVRRARRGAAAGSCCASASCSGSRSASCARGRTPRRRAPRLRERWHSGEALDAETRWRIVNEALPHIETQIELVATRRAALEELEDELTETRRRVREILLELGDESG